MNYYEDLGLSPNASADQIKEAYRALMRLLHPDHQSEPLLQNVAEQQVKKLNRVYAILSDPERRRRYDLTLAEESGRATPIIIHAPPPPPRKSFVSRNSIAWVTAVSVFAVLLIWMASRPTQVAPAYNQDAGAAPVELQPQSSPPSPTASTPAAPSTPSPAAPAPLVPTLDAARTKAEMDGLRLLLAQTASERDTAKQELAALRDSDAKAAVERVTQARAAEERLEQAKAAEERATRLLARAQEVRPDLKQESKAELRADAKKPAARPAPEPIRQAKVPNMSTTVVIAKTEAPPPPPEMAPIIHNPLAGAWVYRKPTVPPKNKDLYPPEFIETVITEDNGQLHGTYRARYQVPNRPVSPEVAFQFNGRMYGESGSLPWNGTGGAKGEVTFTLTADHSLRVDWVASQLGSLGFYKGTAVLVKKSD